MATDLTISEAKIGVRHQMNCIHASTSTPPIRTSRHTPQQQQRPSARVISSKITSSTRGIRRRNEEVECNNQLRAAKTVFRLCIPSSSAMAHGRSVKAINNKSQYAPFLSHEDNVTINHLIAMQQTKHHWKHILCLLGGLLEV
jgi:hypothetical protein